ncbi:MAG: cell division protein FtsW [Lachnospiraceae bacterium]|nr:cell division protein FtsW [Lachnospiraceae bacterium]
MARENDNSKRTRGYYDYSLVIIICFLVCFGMIMLYSTVSYTAQLKNITATEYLSNQIIATVLGFIAMFLISFMDYHKFARFAVLGYLTSYILIFLVLTPLGITVNGATRWIGVGAFSFQPAEFVKIAVILFLAYIINKWNKKIVKLRYVFVILMLIAPISVLLWQITDNLSTALIVAGIAVVVVFVASPDYKFFVSMGIIAIGVVVFIVLKIDWLISLSESFRLERIQAWLSPEDYASGTGFQTLQSLYAIGSGSFFGKGLGNSIQKLNFLPEPQNDMIFAIICEELGLFGAVCVILMFLFMIWRFMVIANNAPDLFGTLLVVGVMGHIAIQVILNIAVVTNTIPNTGITLPFISYGGTSAAFLLAEMGLALSVSRQIKMIK